MVDSTVRYFETEDGTQRRIYEKSKRRRRSTGDARLDYEMEDSGGAYVLSNYTGELRTINQRMIGEQTKAYSEKFVSIPKDNLNYFETEERHSKTLTDTEEQRRSVAESEVDEWLEKLNEAEVVDE